MTVYPEKVKQVLSSTKTLIAHKKEKEILLGEKFNIFSILKMERKENETHSAFICELLNPKGTHLKGNAFLKIFLSVAENDTIDLVSAKVKTEHYIGKKDIEKKTGGRIDIYIWDTKGNTISIENKIDAGDQDVQIKRYHNHNKGKNTVYYLTKFGYNPSNESKDELLENIDYFNISYKTEIIEWLQLCLKECVDNPILRESIKQYMILVKKITNTMENKEQKELDDIILRNIKESAFIASNYEKVLQDIRRKIRNSVIDKLTQHLYGKYSISKGNKISDTYAQIWIKPIQLMDFYLYFGIESFSGRGNFNGHLFIGIFNSKASKDSGSRFADFEGNKPLSNWWPDYKKLAGFEDCSMNLSNLDTIIEIANNKSKFDGFVNHIVEQIEEYIRVKMPSLILFAQKKEDEKI
jgi:hypothetical protein